MQIINPENPTVVLGGEEYEVAKMTDNGKYYVDQIQDLKSEIAELKAKEDKVQELVQWKGRIDEISSPTQLKEMQQSVSELKTFKTTAVTVFAVVQTLMAITVAILKFFV